MTSAGIELSPDPWVFVTIVKTRLGKLDYEWA
jgi:hypothetical protein